VAEKVALAQVFVRVLQFSSVSISYQWSICIELSVNEFHGFFSW